MGRSNWSTILEDTFGSAFRMLLSPNIIESFAKTLLSSVMARTSGNPTLLSYSRFEAIHPWIRSFSSAAASRERAFFLAITNRLPELSPLLDALEHLERSAVAAAGRKGSQLQDFCDCFFCRQHRRDGTARIPTTVIATGICLHHLGMTLITLIWLLGRIDVDETLQPASTGLFMLYEYVVRNDSKATRSTDSIKDYPMWHADLDTAYRRVFELFTGLPSLHKLEAASATCHGGVCIWLTALENSLCDPTEQMRLRVVAGKVSFRDRLYRAIVDMEESELSDDSTSVMPSIAAYGTSRISTLIVRETLDASQLEAWIELRSGKTSSAFSTYLDHLGVERPRRLPSGLILQIRKLYDILPYRIDYGTCGVDLRRAPFQDLPKPDLTTWERPCPSLALLLEPTTSPKRSYNYPEAGEWVVVAVELKGAVPGVQCIRGDFALLYYLMSLEFRDSLIPAYLSIFDGCIRCLAHEFCFNKAGYYRSPQIDVHTIRDDECTHWSAKLTGVLPEDQSDPHPVFNPDTRYQLDETRASTGSLDDDDTSTDDDIL